MGELCERHDSAIAARERLTEAEDMPPKTKSAAPQSEMLTTDVREENRAVNFEIQFWGVRGQVATPGKDTVRYGGNTSCVEMRVGKHRLIFDAGTGLRQLGNNLLTQMPVEVHMFFTHCHWDRIQGFPFFVPAFIPINHFHIYGATASNGASLKERLSQQMLGPNFPVPIQVMQSKMEFYDFAPEEKQCLEDVLVEADCINSLNCSVGYRVSYQGKSVVYAIGTERCSEQPNKNLLHLASQADLLILDAPGVDKCSPDSQLAEWEKTPWYASIILAKEAKAKQVILSLHHPDRDDDFLDAIEARAQAMFPNVSLAKEGAVVSVS